MNPPLSYTDPQTIDAISVITGVTPVSMGGDSIGGAISVETLTPRFAKAGKRLLTGELSTFYRSNGDGFGGALSITAESERLSRVAERRVGKEGVSTLRSRCARDL